MWEWRGISTLTPKFPRVQEVTFCLYYFFPSSQDCRTLFSYFDTIFIQQVTVHQHCVRSINQNVPFIFKVRMFLGRKNVLASPHNFRALFKIQDLVLGLGWVQVQVKGRVQLCWFTSIRVHTKKEVLVCVIVLAFIVFGEVMRMCIVIMQLHLPSVIMQPFIYEHLNTLSNFVCIFALVHILCKHAITSCSFYLVCSFPHLITVLPPVAMSHPPQKRNMPEILWHTLKFLPVFLVVIFASHSPANGNQSAGK